MKNSVPFDIRIVNYINRKLNEYVFRKTEKERISAEKTWYDKFGSSDFLVHQLTPEIKIKLYKDSVLSKMIFDGFENDDIGFLNTILKEGDCFVDIGSNVGLFSLY
ncbi:MAG TPA: hypothetical protein VFJ43_05580, partial [Bacteroidia bacterium]|nr:hypothetical protein [Bacteroidia bacterium]